MKKYKPTTSSRRHLLLENKKLYLTKNLKKKKLKNSLKNRSGKNNLGRTTIFHRGGGNKNQYRIIDFKRSLLNISGIISNIEYDPNRSTYIALIQYLHFDIKNFINYINNINIKSEIQYLKLLIKIYKKYIYILYSYILKPEKSQIGDKIISAYNNIDFKIGNAMPLNIMPIGTLIHNIELKPNKGGQLVKAAGTYARLIGKYPNTGTILIKLPSGEFKSINSQCFATIGSLSNIEHKEINLGKAGRSRWLNIRPTVRGAAMNPIDHPHGGGEGKTSGGRQPTTPWGKKTKGAKTKK